MFVLFEILNQTHCLFIDTFLEGCIIGEKGTFHKEITAVTRCKIVAIQDSKVPHCAEVISCFKNTTANGANYLIRRIMDSLKHMMNDRIAKQCHYEWRDRSAYDDPSYSFKSKTVPVHPIATIHQKPSKRNLPHNNHSSDHHLRVFLPMPRQHIFGKT